MKELIVASRNKGKVGEIKELLADLPFKVTSLLDYPHIPEIIEDGKTYRANALKKAREVALATGKMAMSDDSGIEVKALGNAPGIYSARFAGEGASEKARNKKLFSDAKRCAHAQAPGTLPLCDRLGQCQGPRAGGCAGHLQRLCHHQRIWARMVLALIRFFCLNATIKLSANCRRHSKPKFPTAPGP